MANQDYSPNATIVTTNSAGGAQLKPKNLINAISEIQQFYVIEKQGQDIPAEFLTLEGSLDFFRIGAKSGFNEGVFLVLLFPVFYFYLLPFVFHGPDFFLTTLMDTIPFLPIIVNTILCVYISRYYVGNITRRAINSLFVGRAMLLVIKSFFIYVAYFFLFKLSTPERVWSVAQHFNENAEQVYTGYLEMLPHMIPMATRCSILILISAVIPYGSVYALDHWRRYKIKKNSELIGN